MKYIKHSITECKLICYGTAMVLGFLIYFTKNLDVLWGYTAIL